MNPFQLLRIEWSKYGPNGTFRVFAGLYVGAYALVVYLARATGQNMTFSSNGAISHPLEGMFAYPHNWELLGYIGSWMNAFVLGSLGVFMITMEFSNRTLRQSVIFGLTRPEVAVAKLAWMAAIALVATGYYMLLVLGGAVLDSAGAGLPPAGCVANFFLQALGYLLLGNLAGMLVRQTALAVLGYLAYVFILESAGRWVFYLAVAKTRLLLFLPDQVLGALTAMPVPDQVSHVMNSNPSLVPLSGTEAALGALVYLGLFAGLFCRRIIKSDL